MLRSRAATLLIAAVVGVLAVVGLLTDGTLGAAILLVVAALLAGLSLAAWQHVPDRGKPVRVIIVLLVVAAALLKL